jgi:hypothetical protein
MAYTDLGNIPERVRGLRARAQSRDIRNAEVQAIRRGQFDAVAPDLFGGIFKKPVVANMIDTTARDMAAVLAPLPAVNCSSSSMLSDTSKSFADRRTKIANSYITQSNLAVGQLTGADQYNTFGQMVYCVEPDFETKSPKIRIEDAIGTYAVVDSSGRTREVARVFLKDWYQLCADYPELESRAKDHPESYASGKIECIKYVNDKVTVVYLPTVKNLVLEYMTNPWGFCNYHVATRPGVDDEIRGAYDDVIYVQFARHRLESLLIEGVEKSVRAPLVVGDDVDNVPYGPDSVIRTRGGAGSVGRARIDMPPGAFSAGQMLKDEIHIGAMAPEARSGNIDASVVTGRGVQQLMAGFSSQIAAAQTVFKHAIECVVEMCFRMDEALWPNEKKEIKGRQAGVPYAITYTPKKDIDGDYTVSATYGFAAGLDPNKSLVFLLQADGAGVISKDYLRRNLPVDIDAAEEELKIAVEQSRGALIQSFAALSQSIPQMVAAGGDATTVINQQAVFIRLLQKGKSVEDAAAEAIKPPPPPPAPPADALGAPGGGLGGGPTGAGPKGFDSATGLPAQLQPGLATEGPQGRPDLNMLLAGLTAQGNPNLQANVSRLKPTGSG